MKKSFSIIWIILTLALSWAGAAEKGPGSTEPRTHNGKKWRIGYIQGGPYQDYQSILKELVKALAEMGWMEKTPLPQTADAQETQTLWNWLAHEVKSPYLEFPADAYWDARWDKDLREKNAETVINRLNNQKDIDLMLAFGTWGGKDLANNRHNTPTMICSVSDAIRAGIIPNAQDSGYDHIHVKIDPRRYERQIRLFYEIVKFKRMGMAFQDTPLGRTYAAVEDVKKLEQELDFEMVECRYATVDDIDGRAAYADLLKCHEKLAPLVDAFYITVSAGVTTETLPGLLAPFFKHKVPTFAQGRTTEVKYGALMSMAPESFQGIGRFHAEIFSKIFNGAKPRNLPMVYETLPELTINIETARRIGFHFPMDVLSGAQQIYERIETDPTQ